jgi:alpha-galactosidase
VPLPGLDPDRHYRVVPVEDLLPRSGRVPRWWGLRTPSWEEVHALPPGTRPTLQPDGELGVELSGATLAHAGLMPASINPDHAVLYLVTAVD